MHHSSNWFLPPATPRRPQRWLVSSRHIAAAAATVAAIAMLAGCAHLDQGSPPRLSVPAQPAAAVPEPALQPIPCPSELPAGARCLAGRDSAGAHVLAAVPAAWSGVLVVHAHGGPLLGAPRADRTMEDLQRWAIMVRAGHAWVGSSYAQGGVQVRAAGDDTERARGIFVAQVARPRRTVLHGQSWGASVAAKLAERAGAAYDGVLLTSGVLAGGTRSYDFRLDLRVVYQALCGNHPRPDETDYPLWMGLPAGARMTAADLAGRARACLGLGVPVALRTPEQERKLRTLTEVIRIPERSVLGHLNWATFHFADIAQRNGGRPVFGNAGVTYRGSPDDAALNAAVRRYTVDPAAVREFAADTDPTGAIDRPVVEVHARQDPVAFVELAGEFGRTMARAGRADRLVQVYTDHAEHSYLSDPVYPVLLDALLAWVDTGRRPDAAELASRCEAVRPRFGGDCRMLPGWQPPTLAERVPPR